MDTTTADFALVHPRCATASACRFDPGDDTPNAPRPVISWPDDDGHRPDDGSWGYLDIPNPAWLCPGSVRKSVHVGDWLIFGFGSGRLPIDVVRPDEFAARYEVCG